MIYEPFSWMSDREKLGVVAFFNVRHMLLESTQLFSPLCRVVVDCV